MSSTPTTDVPPAPAGAGPAPADGRGGARLSRFWTEGPGRSIGLVAVLAILVAVGTVTAGDRFLSTDNLVNVLTLGSIIAVVSVGMTFVIIGGGIDLSVGALVALASVWCTTVATQEMAERYGFWVMAGCALLVGAGAGAVNGLAIAYGRVVPFIATLAMLASARGLAELISDRRSQLVTVDSFTDVFRADVLGVPVAVVITALVALAGWVLLNRTTFGRRTFAVGGNAEAARLAGIDVKRHTFWLYVLVGVCCGIAAIMITARTTTGTSTHGLFYELDAIAAVVIGGALLTGGRGTISGTLLGVLVFTVLTNVFTLNNLDTATQNVAKGAIIVAAVLVQQRLSTPLRLRGPG
jgi:ribose transport system permease protein